MVRSIKFGNLFNTSNGALLPVFKIGTVPENTLPDY